MYKDLDSVCDKGISNQSWNDSVNGIRITRGLEICRLGCMFDWKWGCFQMDQRFKCKQWNHKSSRQKRGRIIL